MILKLVLVNTLYFPTVVGGAERTVQGIAEGLALQGHDVTVLTLAEGSKRATFLHNGVKVVKIPLWNIYHPYAPSMVIRPAWWKRLLWHTVDCFNIVMTMRLGRELAAIKADLISTHCLAGFSPLVLKPINKMNVPTVHFLHDYYLICARSAHYNKTERAPCREICTRCSLARKLTVGEMHKLKTIVGVSHYILKLHHSLLRLEYRPNDKVVYNSIQQSARPVKRRLKAKRFGYLGSLLPEKGVLELVEAIARIGDAGLSLDVFGSGNKSYTEKLKEAANPNTKFHGVVNKDDALEQIDVLVVPSLWDEPFGRVVIEAMAAGVPVICSNRGGMPEILKESGGGYIYEPLSGPLSLDSAILAIASLGEREIGLMSDAARRRASDFVAKASVYEQLFYDAAKP